MKAVAHTHIHDRPRVVLDVQLFLEDDNLVVFRIVVRAPTPLLDLKRWRGALTHVTYHGRRCEGDMVAFAVVEPEKRSADSNVTDAID